MTITITHILHLGLRWRIRARSSPASMTLPLLLSLSLHLCCFHLLLLLPLCHSEHLLPFFLLLFKFLPLSLSLSLLSPPFLLNFFPLLSQGILFGLLDQPLGYLIDVFTLSIFVRVVDLDKACSRLTLHLSQIPLRCFIKLVIVDQILHQYILLTAVLHWAFIQSTRFLEIFIITIA